MARMRVHELAKELKMSAKELMDKMLEMGIPVKNHMSMVSDSDVSYIRRHFKKVVKKTRVLDEGVQPQKIIRRRRKETPTVEPEEETVAEGEVQEKAEVVAKEAVSEAVEARSESEELVEEVEARPVEKSGEPEMVADTELTEAEEAGEAQEVAQEVTEEAVGDRLEPEGEKVVAEADVISETGGIVPESAEEEHPVSELAEEVSSEEKAQVEVVEVKEVERPAESVEEVRPQEKEVEPPRAEEGAEVSERAEERKQKRHRRRKRRKSRKHEAAKIVQLPEFIPEPEDDIEEELEQKVRVRIEDEPVKKPFKAGKKFRDRAERKGKRDEEDVLEKVSRPGRQAEEHRVSEEVPEEAASSEVKESRPGTLPPKAGKRKIKIGEAITVGELAKQMGVKAAEVVKKLLLLGLPVTVNQAIDFDTAALVAAEFEYEVEKTGFEEEDILRTEEDRPEDLKPRPPVVTVMGHVDHGKTSLLDAIRHTNFTAEEAGGITQHIGAYHVKLDNGDVVFLDTPGHEAFTAMRARGARVTDIVVLVVAADDGVMQQTVEAINHARAANVPIIVAINKIDKPEANPDRVKRELAEHGLIPEEWGGDTIMVEVSAKKKIGIDDLLEMILLQAELMELKANPNKPARGRVIEAKLEKGRGPVATVLIQEGTLRVGDAYVCGVHYGRVRSLFNDRGQRISEAGPSMPVEVIGLSGVPMAGDDFAVVADEKQARMVAEHRLRKQREKELSRTTKITLEKLYEQIREGELKELNLIIKADVQGSLEALTDAVKRLKHPEIKINIIHGATGAINETDIMLASASNAIVIGFNVRPDSKVEDLAQREHVDVRFYNVIYQVINDIKDAMAGLLEPEYREKILGRAEVRQTFHISRVGTVAGCYVLDGVIQRGAKVRVLRDQVVVYEGKIASLRRFKDDVKEVKAGFECGILVENFNDVKVGDVLEAFVMEEIKPTVDVVGEVGKDSEESEQ
ncbi:translation initiation factor IF-2 [Thermodesulforhabdus norvegica]|uniref:Translation initiation factor IF-2 n=1 Tax=Thermodesulforhabdus norvegica TaxID=39841 RepID=A0A1I4VLH6_9BACT|nr:translation initiation factor IF-2 [Thermodesulforhabdus norvegica]SFN02122.1 bacterial translation initiation factor 2 (bIF-2) [Thermodesulforhabdus norvegica]